MKQTPVTRFFNFILVGLGFTSTVSCHLPFMSVMYGTPTMDFEVSGKVVNQQSEPIPGIKVSCNDRGSGPSSVLTDQDGSFSISGTATSAWLGFEDIDGPENGGEYAGMHKDIDVKQVEKGDGWYMGKYEARNVVIRMTEKEKEKE